MIYKTLKKISDVRFVKSYKSIMICKTKNLFPTSTAIGTLDGWSQTTARQFEEDKWYIGITGTNYYIPSNIIEYELTGNYVYINTVGNSYGIGKAFKCEPNQTYTISCNWVENTNYMQISIGFYDGNGNYLSYNAAANLEERHTFTTPANCKWFTVCFAGGTGGSSYVYNMQLEEGSTPTAFVPNGYIQSYKKSLICKTKNLFPTSTAIGTLDGWSQTTARQFEEDKWYIGITGTNYYIPSNIIEYELTGNYVYINTVGNSYGIGKAFKCEPNQTYTISCNWVEITNYMQINTGFYDGNGNYLSYNAAADLAERYTVTTPANCKWFTVCFIGNSSGSSYVYNIQLELGDTATEYHPYGYL